MFVILVLFAVLLGEKLLRNKLGDKNSLLDIILSAIHKFPRIARPSADFIGVEGNISAGKSTLIRTLGQYGYHILPEDVDSGLLKLFYANQLKYAFSLQLNTYFRRSMNIQNQRLLHPNKVIIQDRSLIGDLIFAMAHYFSGNMSKAEMAVYINAAKIAEYPQQNINQYFQKLGINKFVYLFANPLRCHESVKKRGDVDAGIPLLYLQKIHQLHFHTMLYLKSKGADIRFINWSAFGDIKHFQDATSQARSVNNSQLIITNELVSGNKDFSYDHKADAGSYYIDCGKLDKYEDLSVKAVVPDEYSYVIPYDKQEEIVAALNNNSTVYLTNVGNSFIDLLPLMISTVSKE